MPSIPALKIGGDYSLVDALLVGGSKVAIESLGKSIVGNGTVKSGVTKLALALGLNMTNNKLAKLASLGVAVDAVEDLDRKSVV